MKTTLLQTVNIKHFKIDNTTNQKRVSYWNTNVALGHTRYYKLYKQTLLYITKPYLFTTLENYAINYNNNIHCILSDW